METALCQHRLHLLHHPRLPSCPRLYSSHPLQPHTFVGGPWGGVSQQAHSRYHCHPRHCTLGCFPLQRTLHSLSQRLTRCACHWPVLTLPRKLRLSLPRRRQRNLGAAQPLRRATSTPLIAAFAAARPLYRRTSAEISSPDHQGIQHQPLPPPRDARRLTRQRNGGPPRPWLPLRPLSRVSSAPPFVSSSLVPRDAAASQRRPQQWIPRQTMRHQWLHDRRLFPHWLRIHEIWSLSQNLPCCPQHQCRLWR